jgi:hypothetical protein
MVITEFTVIVGAGTDLPLSELSFSAGDFVSATLTSFPDKGRLGKWPDLKG